MDRRALLTSVAATGVVGGTGCQRLHAFTSENDGQRKVQIETQASVSATHQLTIAVDRLEQSMTDAHPARIEITTTNEGPPRAVSVGQEQCCLFNRSDGGSDNPEGLWLYRPEDTQNLDRKDDRWVHDRSRFADRSFPAYGCGATRYDTGESVSTEYEVWDDFAVGGYFEPDTYRWQQEIHLWDDPDAEGTEDPTTPFTWGFSLSVKKAD